MKENDIVLRPRFQLDLLKSKQIVLEAFVNAGNDQDNLIVNRIDDHVFIKYPKHKQHFWSPQLHIEVNTIVGDEGSKLYGLYGPNPNAWLVFMFLHFVVAAIFLGFGIWAYSNWSLNVDYFFQALVAGSMIVIWIFLYIIGRFGRSIAKPEMDILKIFLEDTLNKILSENEKKFNNI